MVEILIRLEDDLYEQCKTTSLTEENEGFYFHILKSVANGILLPKGHGRLKDENEIKRMIEEAKVNSESSKSFAENIIRFAPTILESEDVR